jgi:hypothetical protein
MVLSVSRDDASIKTFFLNFFLLSTLHRINQSFLFNPTMTTGNTLKRRAQPLLIWLTVLVTAPAIVDAFLVPNGKFSSFADPSVPTGATTRNQHPAATSFVSPRTPTALSVWWFGGTEEKENFDEDSDSCELVAVRIEKSSPNSRKIAGDITVGSPIDDVWAILTDYNRLSIHVPNLVESKVVSSRGRGSPGDGMYQCRLYQKGAQKIIGFEFGADVTMDMTERIVSGSHHSPSGDDAAAVSYPETRKIAFKCVDSMFFSEFDGEWSASEMVGENGEQLTKLSYVVDVRPKGPVPVAALEWRIREDVPTNLRAVKRAAMTVGEAGVLASRPKSSSSAPSLKESVRRNVQLAAGRLGQMNWGEDETMAVYLKSE